MPDNDEIIDALRRGGIIDITTTGRKSGEPRRIEMVFHPIDDRVFISGKPGKRAWLANVEADPRFTFHLKRALQADLPATARIISDVVERRRVLAPITRSWRSEDHLEAYVDRAPLIEVIFEDPSLLSPRADAA